jgi:uncharacterized DUF497 family protein
MDFEWDTAKDEGNQRKHKIGFREAAEIFRSFIVVTADTRRDYGERRWVALGEYDDDLIRVVFTRRGDLIRIISAWKAGRHDREIYQEAKQDRPL